MVMSTSQGIFAIILGIMTSPAVPLWIIAVTLIVGVATLRKRNRDR